MLGALAARLGAIVAGLTEVHDGLPAPDLDDATVEEEVRPDLTAELLGAIESVVSECLASALETLQAVARLTEDELERELWRERARMQTAGWFQTAPSPQLQLAL